MSQKLNLTKSQFKNILQDEKDQIKLKYQIANQQKIIDGLKNLVVTKENNLVKSPFELQLQKFLNKSLADDIKNSLDDIVEIHRDHENNKYIRAKSVETKFKVNKSISTEDEYNLLLAACKGDHRKFIGELSFEIEFRILKHVFGNKMNLYGMSVRQINDKIIEMTTNYLTLQPDYEQRNILLDRFETILSKISEVGYKREFHPSLTEHYITRFGHFNYTHMPEKLINLLAPDSFTRNLFKKIMKLAFPKYKLHAGASASCSKNLNQHPHHSAASTSYDQRQSYLECKILIDTLLEIARFDHLPIFSWQERKEFEGRNLMGDELSRGDCKSDKKVKFL